MVSRLLAFLVAAAAALAALLLAWPQAFGLQDQLGFAQVVAFRAVLIGAAIVAIALFGLLCLIRPARKLMAALTVIALLFGVANAVILATRGFGQTDTPATASTSKNSVTVVSWNTLGGHPGAAAVAKLALDQKADIVSLPETTDDFATEVAERMRAGGRPMWALGLSFSDVYKARSTALLISPDLGDYTVESAGGTGPPGNTNVSPTVVARPDDGDGPTIIAVHAVSPLRGEMTNWRSDLNWLASQCQSGDVIMAGDFNATLDHMWRHGDKGGQLGSCKDAALQTGAAAVGTWPSDLPTLLGSPIDHVLATSAWVPTRFQVITSLDDLGSDHRPIVATLERR
ncbi:endonuclease/exonuclease/phosphatase family protein [Rathayibacter sp. YIM 133350]|uniref:endonuclease/exonuclease/phosphatase family protein n=1 Tax=Rathayibacter sp. YIM 133350 TaxID=3131992 RepID=UPI00307FB73B